MNDYVRLTITGPTGSGKTAIYMEVLAALNALGVTVRHANPKVFNSEMNMGSGDAYADLEMYQPIVVMAEVNEARNGPQPKLKTGLFARIALASAVLRGAKS